MDRFDGCREQQDLKNNAVRTAIIHEGSGNCPATGDVVIFHYTIRDPGSKAVLASTSTSHGGCGCPHVCAIDKSQRVPRGWELVLMGMLSVHACDTSSTLQHITTSCVATYEHPCWTANHAVFHHFSATIHSAVRTHKRSGEVS